MQVLVFELGSQRFAVPADAVREVRPMVAVTPLPSAPAVVEGVIDVHGDIVPVYSLRHRFELVSRPPSIDDHLVILEVEGTPAALRVDRTVDVVDLGGVEARRVETVLGPAPGVAGALDMPGGLILMPDLATFLTAAEREALQRATSGEGALR